MNPAHDPDVNYRTLVEQGYDRCAAAYAEARKSESNPELEMLTRQLESGAAVLDIGCGAGVPIAQALAEHFQVTGIDISGEQIRRARLNVPGATFIHSDIMSVNFASGTFDAVVAFYSIFHLPREEHPELLWRIHNWLRRGGYLLLTVTRHEEAPYTEDDFFGVSMYWSNYGVDEYKAILTRIGFELLETAVIGHGYTEVKQAPPEYHPLIFAQAT